MARQPRRLPPQGTFHVYNRGACRQDLFLSVADREFFLNTLARVAQDLGWSLLAFCLMGNHYHLVVETPRDNLSEGMHLLGTRFAIRFKRENAAAGHVFESRFKSPPVESLDYFEYLLGYLALNPVTAGFCERPEEWGWSSFSHVMRGRPTITDTRRLFERLGDPVRDPLAEYGRCLRLAARAR